MGCLSLILGRCACCGGQANVKIIEAKCLSTLISLMPDQLSDYGNSYSPFIAPQPSIETFPWPELGNDNLGPASSAKTRGSDDHWASSGVTSSGVKPQQLDSEKLRGFCGEWCWEREIGDKERLWATIIENPFNATNNNFLLQLSLNHAANNNAWTVTVNHLNPVGVGCESE